MGNGAAVRSGSKKYRARLSEEAPRGGNYAEDVPLGGIYTDGGGKWGAAKETEKPRVTLTGAKRAAARRAVRRIAETEAGKSQELWEDFSDELNSSLSGWRPAGGASKDEAIQARAVLQASIALGDSAHLAVSLEQAKKKGLPVGTPALRDVLDRLLAQEDLEGTWRCLASALEAADSVALRFWIDEARAKGLQVPIEVMQLWKLEEGIRDAEAQQAAVDAGRDAQMRYDALATEAYEGRDLATLRQVTREARGRAYVDYSLAVALLAALEAEAEERCPGSTGVGSARLPSHAESGDEDLVALRKWGVHTLKAELTRRGVDILGACEKEELVQLLHAELKKQPKLKPSKPKPKPKSGEASSGGGDAGQRRASAAAKASNCYDTAGGPSTASSNTAGGSPKASEESKSSPRPARAAPPSLSRSDALKILGLEVGSSKACPEELRKAYKRAAMRWHPDRRQNHGNEKEAKQRFQEAIDAYELLQRTR